MGCFLAPVSTSPRGLLGVERAGVLLAVDLNAATANVCRVGEGALPSTLSLGGREPEAEEVATGSRREVVDIRRAGVEDVGVGNKLQVANLEDHVQGQALGSRLEDLDGLELGGSVTGNLTRLDEARDCGCQWDAIWAAATPTHSSGHSKGRSG